ncbi:DUF1697 domain-containing protein [Devosia sp. A449]
MALFVVLLRAIGPITHKVMSMQQWRDGVAAAGYDNPQTYVATGNMIVGGDGALSAVTEDMNAVVRGLGLGPGNIAVVRTPAQLRALFAANPFPEASAERPSEVAIYCFAGDRPDFAWVADYDGPERIHIAGEHLIVDYSGQLSASPRLPGLIEKRSGAVTARNWNTLRGLVERANARESN